jgi:hypothetical protein
VNVFDAADARILVAMKDTQKKSWPRLLTAQ